MPDTIEESANFVLHTRIPLTGDEFDRAEQICALRESATAWIEAVSSANGSVDMRVERGPLLYVPGAAVPVSPPPPSSPPAPARRTRGPNKPKTPPAAPPAEPVQPAPAAPADDDGLMF